VRTIGSLEHPNIVPIHDVGIEDNGDYYFVMKYVAGETLESIIEKLAAGDRDAHARFGSERRVQIFIALLEAVGFAHSKGILHRDIKPANVMVGAYGEVVLMDWGIAKRLREPAQAPAGLSAGLSMDGAPPSGAALQDGALLQEGAVVLQESAAAGHTGKGGSRGELYRTRSGELIGTPAYMSPEQSRGEPIDERSDVYSLCVLFYELLTLNHPLAEKTTLEEMLHAVRHEPVPIAGVVTHPQQPSVAMDLSWFLRKGLAKDPAQRYASVAEMLTRLERRAEGIIPIQCHITFMKRVSNGVGRFIDRHPIVTTGIMLAGVVEVVMTGLRMFR
jgi:eukaryotic-like serine/threonine-protein kinase